MRPKQEIAPFLSVLPNTDSKTPDARHAAQSCALVRREAMYRLSPLIGRLRDQPVFELSIARRQKMRNAFERPDGKSILDPGDQPERRPRRHLFSGQPQDVGDICER